jgi:hypothetical protein
MWRSFGTKTGKHKMMKGKQMGKQQPPAMDILDIKGTHRIHVNK